MPYKGLKQLVVGRSRLLLCRARDTHRDVCTTEELMFPKAILYLLFF
jgi:hypothetical protein